VWFVWGAGSHGVHEINHNDDYEWYYNSLNVVDGGQPLYRGATQLTAVDVDIKTAARCCSRRPDDAHGASFTEPCEYGPRGPCAYLIYSVLMRTAGALVCGTVLVCESRRIHFGVPLVVEQTHCMFL